MENGPPPNNEVNSLSDTTKLKPPSIVRVDESNLSDSEDCAFVEVRSTRQRTSSNQPVVRRKSSSHSCSEVKPDQVAAGVEPVVLGYFMRRAELDERNEAASSNQDHALVRFELFRALNTLMREHEYSRQSSRSISNSQTPVAADAEPEVLELSASNSRPYSSAAPADADLNRMIGSELASLGDFFQSQLRDSFEKTYSLLEQRAAIVEGNGANQSLLAVFQNSVRRLLINQPLTWGTLITLLEFAYYVMRQLVFKLIRSVKSIVGSMVTRVRELVTAVVGYIGSADSGIIDWLVGEGGWGAALDLDFQGVSDTDTDARFSDDQATDNTLNVAWHLTLGAFLVLGVSAIIASQND